MRLFTGGGKAPAFRRASDETFRSMARLFSQNVNDLIQAIPIKELGIGEEVELSNAVVN